MNKVKWVTMSLALCCAASAAAAAPVAGTAAGEAAKGRGKPSIAELQGEVRSLRDEVAILAGQIKQLQVQAVSQREPQRESIDLDGAPVLGNRQAKIGIVEFSDFQCPYCRRFHELVYPTLKSRYIDTGKVSFIVKDFPLNFHAHAMSAAIAVNCAREQDPAATWDVQDDLFSHQKDFGDKYFEALAKHFKLDKGRYQACLKDSQVKQRVERELNYGMAAGVSGTPTFFIGRVDGDQLVDALRVEGVQPISVFAQVIASLGRKADRR